MKVKDWYLSIDQGGGSSRAIVFDQKGNVVAKAQQTVSVDHPRIGWVEQDAEELVESILSVLLNIEKQLESETHRIQAAGLATQRSNVVCWDRRTGAALSPAISWQDRRAYQWIETFQDQSPLIRRKTGLVVSAHYGVSKFKWCLDNISAVAQARENDHLAYGPLASFLIFRLLLQPRNLVDPANASRTLLWNIDNKNWDSELLSLFGVPGQFLPECVASCARFGDMKLGKNIVPLTVVTGDQSAALYAFGVPEKDTAYINMGTGVFIQRPTGTQKFDVPGLLCSVVYQDPQQSYYVIESTVNGAANALMEVEDVLGISGHEAEQKFDQWLKEIVEPPLFLNGVAGLGAPYWVPNFPCKFIGEGEAEAKIVAVAESFLFLTWINLQLSQQQYKPLSKLVVTGGLANSDGLCQKLANLVKLPVYRPAQAEATALGVAFLAAGMPGSWTEQQSGHWFAAQQEPDLDNRFDRWFEEMQKQLKRFNKDDRINTDVSEN